MIIDVTYPSGTKFTLYGKWVGFGSLSGKSIVVVDLERDVIVDGTHLDRDTVFAGDPRGIYVNRQNGQVLHTPRMYLNDVEAWVQEWMAENPTWGVVNQG